MVACSGDHMSSSITEKNPSHLNSFTIQLADETWLHVFSHLSQEDLCQVALVSTRFKRLALDPSLWQKIELQKVSLSLEAWQGIVSRCSRLSSLTLRLQAVFRIRIWDPVPF